MANPVRLVSRAQSLVMFAGSETPLRDRAVAALSSFTPSPLLFDAVCLRLGNLAVLLRALPEVAASHGTAVLSCLSRPLLRQLQ